MADPWDVPPKPADLPDPELNPLMNPTLGKNLGRWAQVYFTSSPETREEAVGQLLRELERGEPVGAYPANNGEPLQKRESSANTVLCPRCNEWNSVDQNFCGICGTRIPVATQPPPAPRIVAGQDARQNQWTPAPSASDDSAWLRESVFSANDEPQHSSRKAWIFAVLALLLILGGAAYLQYAPNKRASTAAPTTTPGDSESAVPPATQPEPPAASTTAAPSTAASPASPATAQPAHGATIPAAPSQPNASATTEDSAAAHESASTTAPKTTPEVARPRPAPRTSPVSVDNGSSELAEAQRLLTGPGTTRNPEVAAALLWKSVKKENAGAEVQLADLYARGQGVSKNCEQARLLLTAAAKKGASDAAQKLRQLQSGGCQ